MSARDVERARAVVAGALPVPLGHAEPADVEAAPTVVQRLDEIEAREQAATAGPWCTDAWEIYQGAEYEPGLSLWIGDTCRGTGSLEQDRADAAFVAASRADVPELVAVVRLLLAERDALRAERDELQAHADFRMKDILRLREQCATLAAQVAGVNRLLEDVQPWADAADRTAGLKAKPAGLRAEDWNERYPVGICVRAYPGTRDDVPLKTRTRSRAWTLGHGAAVVMVEGHSAGISLTHVDPAEAGDVS
ncbi:hypothetical protein [Streptomyces sp. NPDC047315]|uniref:hypothetical protein n=1 Tax=Streptomyces sp. NPDC047315 TaxID=3155142 RepID=UPI003405F80F